MADIPISTTTTATDRIDLTNIAGGSRIVVVVDPTTVSGGTVLYDKNVPEGKILNGALSLSSHLDDEE